MFQAHAYLHMLIYFGGSIQAVIGCCHARTPEQKKTPSISVFSTLPRDLPTHVPNQLPCLVFLKQHVMTKVGLYEQCFKGNV